MLQLILYVHQLLLLVQLARLIPTLVLHLVQLVQHVQEQTAVSLLPVLQPQTLFVALQQVQLLALLVNLYLAQPVLRVQQEHIKTHPPLLARLAQHALLAPLV